MTRDPDLAAQLARLQASRSRAVILIDGPAGSGKSTLAGRLADTWPEPIQVAGLDDFYPGWTGLAAGSAMVSQTVLRPLDPGFQRWDWTRDCAGDWVSLDPTRPLIVEGCGALTPDSRRLASLGIWCELDPAERKARALARDGMVFAQHWDEWAAQEAEHWRRHRPWELADVTLSGPGAPDHDPSHTGIRAALRQQPDPCPTM